MMSDFSVPVGRKDGNSEGAKDRVNGQEATAAES